MQGLQGISPAQQEVGVLVDSLVGREAQGVLFNGTRRVKVKGGKGRQEEEEEECSEIPATVSEEFVVVRSGHMAPPSDFASVGGKYSVVLQCPLYLQSDKQQYPAG